MRTSLGWRMAATFLLIIFLVVGTASYLLFDTFRRQLVQDRSVAVLTQANIIASGLASAIGHDPAGVQDLLGARSREIDGRLLLLDPEGQVVADAFAEAAEASLVGQTLRDPLMEAALEGQQETSVRLLENAEWVMYAAVPVVHQGDIGAVLFVSTSLEDITASLTEVAGRMALYLGVSLLVVTAASLWMAHRLTLPLKSLSRAAERLGEGVLSERVSIDRGDELGSLGQTFNQMASQLEHLDSSRRRFLGDASHEMRTPLGTIKILVEGLLAQEAYDPEETRRLLESIDAGTDRLAGLLESLLTLTHLEHAGKGARQTWEPVNLGDVAAQAAGDCGARAESQGITLQVNSTGDAWILGDEEALYRAVLNLVDNALQYTPAGGSVAVTVRHRDDWLCVEVKDTGRGIRPEALPHVFERFYRPDQARTRKSGGFGLGLAIVEETVKLHGGQVRADSEPARGTTITLCFPPAAPE